MASRRLARSLDRIANRLLGLALYDPSRERAVAADALVLPKGQGIYDPAVFGRYDLASQRVVPKDAGSAPFNLDLVTAAAQRRHAEAPLFDSDRYRLALSWLPRGDGICLDACTAHLHSEVRDAVQGAGYEYVPIDLAPGPGIRREDLTRLSFADASVSCVLSIDTLEHIPDYAAAVREMFRVLRPGAPAIIHVPCYYFDKPTSEPIGPDVDPWGHVRYFSARELMAVYEAAGFINLRTAFLFDYGATLSALAKPA